MLKHALLPYIKAIIKFLCTFIPFSKLRKRTRNRAFRYLDNKFLSDKIITLDKVDSHLPRAVLAQISAHNNEYFTTKNRQITAIIGGGTAIIATPIAPTPKKHTLATLTLIKIPLIPTHHLILGLLSAFAMRLSRLGLV